MGNGQGTKITGKAHLNFQFAWSPVRLVVTLNQTASVNQNQTKKKLSRRRIIVVLLHVKDSNINRII